ncbi:MAG TPA: peroxiredoxin [Afifellaceae bacterium]|nr:peroxiredoxin [Afifellaceae bacterium]
MTIAPGERLPETTFYVMAAEGPEKRTTQEVFGGRRVVLFGVPGAFTPTCHRSHLPGFLAQRDAILAKGVDAIAVLSVNDAFVMDAWARDTGGKDRLVFLADGNADFVRAAGLDQDSSHIGRGTRAKRFSMVVEDGVVKAVNVEEETRQVTVSGAERILEQLAG